MVLIFKKGKKWYRNIAEAIILILFVVAIVSLHGAIGPHRLIAKLLFFFGWLSVTCWAIYSLVKLTFITVDGDTINDYILSYSLILSTYISYTMFSSLTFQAFWVINETKYWSNLPLWDSPNSSLLTLSHMTFIALLTDAFNLVQPIHFLPELIYGINFAVVYLFSLLVIGTVVSIISSSRTESKKSRKKSLINNGSVASTTNL